MSQKKCGRVHVGKGGECPVLKVYEAVMKDSHEEKYLGDKGNKNSAQRICEHPLLPYIMNTLHCIRFQDEFELFRVI